VKEKSRMQESEKRKRIAQRGTRNAERENAAPANRQLSLPSADGAKSAEELVRQSNRSLTSIRRLHD
jgi:hypothetical protein